MEQDLDEHGMSEQATTEDETSKHELEDAMSRCFTKFCSFLFEQDRLITAFNHFFTVDNVTRKPGIALQRKEWASELRDLAMKKKEWLLDIMTGAIAHKAMADSRLIKFRAWKEREQDNVLDEAITALQDIISDSNQELMAVEPAIVKLDQFVTTFDRKVVEVDQMLKYIGTLQFHDECEEQVELQGKSSPLAVSRTSNCLQQAQLRKLPLTLRIWNLPLQRISTTQTLYSGV
ncbi:MAG: hypothetical protein Q9210_001794 [Variospora velana]